MKQLVLLGGGHAHVKVLSSLAECSVPGWKVHLVSPYRRQIYSGMLPGWLAGHYPVESCAIELDPLATRASAGFHTTSAVGLDFARNVVQLANGQALPFDRLSIDTGSVTAIDGLPGAVEHALPVRPIENFITAWSETLDRIACTWRPFHLAVVGAGAAGVEMALAIQRRSIVEGWFHLRVTLVGCDSPLPLEAGAPPARRRIAQLLNKRGIAWKGRHCAVRVDDRQLVFGNGETMYFDACFVVTGAAAPAWPAAAGLATDEWGFIRVGPTLQSVSHPQVFAAGDVAAYHTPRPKSGVFAVRAGPVLAENIRAACEGRPLRFWSPQRRALYLVSTGERHAVASWGPWACSGQWVWRWKDWIDRRFMRRFGTAALMLGSHPRSP